MKTPSGMPRPLIQELHSKHALLRVASEMGSTSVQSKQRCVWTQKLQFVQQIVYCVVYRKRPRARSRQPQLHVFYVAKQIPRKQQTDAKCMHQLVYARVERLVQVHEQRPHADVSNKRRMIDE